MAKILLGYTRCQRTREAFEKHGHDVTTCDLRPAYGLGKHMQCDIREAAYSQRWDFGLFHPMCTFLTVSAAWAFEDPNYDKYPGVGYHQKVKIGTLVGAARRAAREVEIENFRWILGLDMRVVVENPGRSFVSTAIRPADQIIHPYQHGDDASKATGLWLKGIFPLKPTKFVEPRWVRTGDMPKPLPRWANQTDSGQNNLTPSNDRWLERSNTYQGIAAAMGDQWGRFLNEAQGWHQ